jgi:tetratricopeptide (TPR) repeat protein
MLGGGSAPAPRNSTLEVPIDHHLTPARIRCLALALFAAIVGVFSGVVDCGFVQLDDPSHVYENAVVRGGLTPEGMRTAFSAPHASLWVPLTTLSFMLDASVLRLDPGLMHLENVVWHAGAAVFLFLALGQLTGRWRLSALVAAVFGLHPINVESVAWITERKNVLCAFFAMLSLWSWAHFAKRPRWIPWLAAFVALALALLAKPMAVTLPFALLVLDDWPLRRWGTVSWQRLIGEKAPLFALSFAASRMATWATGPRDALVSLDQLPLDSRFTNALTSIAAYLRQLLLPAEFAVLYPHPFVAQWLPGLAALALIFGVTFLAWRARKTQPWLLAGWCIFLGMLVPSLGIVQVGCQARADRFTYLAQIGLFVAVIWSADRFWPAAARRLRIPTVAALLLTLAALSARQVRAWTDSITLFEHALAVTGPHPQMLDLAAAAHERRGDAATAIRYWQHSLALLPDNPATWNELRTALARRH